MKGINSMKLKTYIVYSYNRALKYFLNLNILNTDESIERIKNSNKSLVRYGDGEMSIILGGFINFQKYDEVLSRRLREILKSSESNLEIGIPLAIKNTDGYNNVAKKFWKQNMDTGRMHWKRLCNPNRIYCNASMTRLFRDYEDKSNSIRWFKNFKQIWNDKDILLIEGSKSKLGINNDLFSNAKSVERIIAPSKNAFDKYDEILAVIKERCKGKLVLLSLGPTATVLAYDLCKNGIRALDIGHIQLEYNEFHQYINKNKIQIESNEKVLSEEEYKNQIIFKI